MNIDVLKGKTIDKYSNNGDSLILECRDGSVYQQHHYQDCCESVTIEDVCGELDDLVGNVIIDAFEKVSDGGGESSTWTFYTIVTANTAVTIRWYGSSNGYYSESVSFEEVTPPKPVAPACERCHVKAQEYLLKFDTAKWNICEDCKEIAIAVFNAYMYPEKT